jgi:methionine-rich copper-binding protein CopC
MTHATPLWNRRRTPRWFLALVAALLAIPIAVATAGPVAAHTKLVSSSPAEGAALDAAPTQVVLTFNEAPKSVTSVKAQDTNGPLVALGDPVLEGETVRVSWPQDQAPGLFRLVYVLVSDDGDPVEGTLLFSYAGGAGASASATASTAVPALAAVDTGSTMGRAWLVGVALLVLAVIAVLVVSRRRRQARDSVPTGSSASRASEDSVV